MQPRVPQAWIVRHRRTAVIAAALLLAAVPVWRFASAQSDRGSELVERAMSAKPNAANGRALYKEFCVACHGEGARGAADTITPALAGQLQSYLVKQLADFAEGQRGEPAMQRVVSHKRLTSPQALRDLASHIAALPRNTQPEVGDGKNLDRGRRVYERSCSECHGLRAGGEPDFVPALQGQHYSYLLKQVRSFSAGQRGGLDVDVIHDMQALDLEEVMAVTDYISRLPADARRPVMAPRRAGNSKPAA